jgi:hypothetical protein
MKQSFVGRSFQFWEYHVSHGELLVRSPRRSSEPTNMDLMFFGVQYVELPRHLDSMEVDDPSDADVARARDRLGKNVDASNVTAIVSEGRRVPGGC